MDQLSELVEITKTINELSVRQEVLRNNVLKDLVKNDAQQLKLKDDSTVYLQYRKPYQKRPSVEERANETMMNLNAREIYECQKEAFLGTLKAAYLSTLPEKRYYIPSSDNNTKASLVVNLKKQSLSPEFEDKMAKQGHRRSDIRKFLSYYHYGKKYGSMTLEQAWENRNVD